MSLLLRIMSFFFVTFAVLFCLDSRVVVMLLLYILYLVFFDVSFSCFGQANPGKYALMICVELSSVHTTFDDNINDAILHAIFADGCAAAVLKGARKSECPKVCSRTQQGVC